LLKEINDIQIHSYYILLLWSLSIVLGLDEKTTISEEYGCVSFSYSPIICHTKEQDDITHIRYVKEHWLLPYDGFILTSNEKNFSFCVNFISKISLRDKNLILSFFNK
jgi:hypothetical protein